MRKKLLVCDVEGTIFKAEYKISGTDYSSTMWQPLARELDKYNSEHGIDHTDTVEKERQSNEEWEKGVNGKYKGIYMNWVEDTVRIHCDNGMNKCVFDEVLNKAEFQNGVKEFFASLDTDKFIPVLISGGFQELMEKAQKELTDKNGKPFIKHGFAACRYIWDESTDDTPALMRAWNIQPSDFKDKYSYLKIILDQYKLSETSDWIFIGDGKNDADIASRAPISFAITPHPELAAVATYTIDSFMEINDLLNSDESERALSKKRGLSNKQSVIVGQRLINAGELETIKYTDNFKTENSTLKYQLYASISPKENVFFEIYNRIIEWCESYADDADKFRKDLLDYNDSSSFIYEYDGVAKINIARIKSDTENELGVHINSQDTGTELRQAVLGGRTDIHIGIFQRTNEDVKLKVDIVTKLPANSYVKKHNISLESYCPIFVKELCKDGFVIKVDGEKRLSFNLEKLDVKKVKSVFDEKENSFPLVFIYDNYCDDLSKIASYTFGFAKVYKCDDRAIEKVAEILDLQKDNLGVIVSFPKGFDTKPHFYSGREITKPKNDAIGYKDNKRVLYSASEKEGKIAVAINISDNIIEEYKKNMEKITVDDSILYYDSISKKITENKNSIMLKRAKIQSTDNIIKSSRDEIKNRNIDFEKIRKIKAVVDKELSSYHTEIKKYNDVLTGMKEFLEKGELILALQYDITSDPNEKVPLSILQPIACAFEICVNIWLYCVEKENYFEIKSKKENRECGRILYYMENDGRIIAYCDQDTRKILWEANECRTHSAHPNEMRPFSEINGIEKEKLYSGIELVARKICELG